MSTDTDDIETGFDEEMSDFDGNESDFIDNASVDSYNEDIVSKKKIVEKD